MSLLKIFSDRRYVYAGQPHEVILFPFWGPVSVDKVFGQGTFDNYIRMGSSFFQIVSLKDADLAVMPVSWDKMLANEQSKGLGIEFAQLAEEAGKKVAIFCWGDIYLSIPVENAVVFRHDLYKSKKKANEFAFTTWSEDFMKIHLGSQLPLRTKSKKPTVGFCGLADPIQRITFKDWTRAALDFGLSLMRGRTPHYSWREILKGNTHATYPGHRARSESLSILSKSQLVETNFNIRDRFMARAYSPDGKIDHDKLRTVRDEYVRNMVDSDYIVCARGAGNYSIRLSEALSCGRIPLFINTDCVLPYDWLIDWRKFTVWVDESDLSKVAERVAAFHEALSPDDFRELQLSCRKLWEDWLCPEGFFANFYRHFEL
jgi:hypothetical protein